MRGYFNMKTTDYFNYRRNQQDRTEIKDEWINFVIENPEKTIIQSDSRIKLWAYIPEASKYLRVILLEDAEPVHNAFFDRSYKKD